MTESHETKQAWCAVNPTARHCSATKLRNRLLHAACDGSRRPQTPPVPTDTARTARGTAVCTTHVRLVYTGLTYGLGQDWAELD